MTRKPVASIRLLVPLGLALLASAPPAWAASPVHRLTTIQVPGNPLARFDISWWDPASERYYLADRSNAAVDIFDVEENTFLTRVDGFVGFTGNNDTSGPNGIVVIKGGRELWAGDGNSTVQVIDLTANPPHMVDTIFTGGAKRADEMAFDPKDHILLVANDAEEPHPFITFISTKSGHQIVGQMVFDGSQAPLATDGIEQAVWDPATKRFYVAVPEVNGGDGEITVIDPKTRMVTGHFPVPNCTPHGLALGPNQHLLLGCNKPGLTLILDARTGATVASITQVGGSDEVWFNPGDHRYYLAANRFSGGPVLGVIDARTNTWLQNVSVGPRGTNSHSVAADAENNHVFVPLTPIPTDPACVNGCIGVFGQDEDDD